MRRRIFKGVIGLLGLAVVLGSVVGLNALSGPAIGTACALPGTEGDGPSQVQYASGTIAECRTYRVDEPQHFVSPYDGTGVTVSVARASGSPSRLRALFDDGTGYVFPLHSGEWPTRLLGGFSLIGFSGTVNGRYAVATRWEKPLDLGPDEIVSMPEDAPTAEGWQPEYVWEWEMRAIPPRPNERGLTASANSFSDTALMLDISSSDPLFGFSGVVRVHEPVEFVGVGMFRIERAIRYPQPSRFSEERNVVGRSSGEATIRFVTDPALLPH